MTTTDARCENCGCGLTEGACPACGLAPVAAPVGGVSAQSYALAPAPLDSYEIELGPTQALAWTFRLWSENLARLSVLGALPYALALLIGGGIAAVLFTSGDPFDAIGDGAWPFLLAGGTIAAVLYLVLTTAAAGAAIHLVNEKTQGVSVPALGALAAVLRQSGWLVCAFLFLMLIASAGVAGIGSAIFYGFFEESAPRALILPGLALPVLTFFVVARLTPLLPVIVIEDRDFFSAVSRTWTLTRGRGVMLPALLFCAVYGVASGMSSMIAIVPILGALIQMGINALLLPLAWVFPFVVYAGCVRAEASAQR